MNKYIFTLTLVHTVAWAQDEFESILDGYRMLDDEIDTLEDLIAASTAETTTLPRGSPQYPRHYFKGDHYLYGLDADEKLAQLWEMLVPDETVVEEPTPFFWTGFDDFF